ncbi:MAG: LysM peptidoglycan-binding domain-containing protein [Actinomycetota bacterium]|nr:LysM peptidoglycan-binding domain-containing protein [Actinomycetota bacterium]HSH23634.1 hypothetical protein [Acidimicrobiales bacterium]
MDRARLTCKMPPGMVYFDFNPTALTFSRQMVSQQRGSSSAQSGSPAGSTATIFRGSPQSSITIDKLILVGADTKYRCDTLLGWLSPNMGLVGALMSAVGVPLASRPPVLIFQWGPPMAGFMYDCVLKSCKIIYKRFDPSGIPLRAEASLTLQQQPSLLASLPTNPTSGGLRGRQRHVVSDGENLQTIATATYGRPGHWRAVAEANGIDDPLRVRPGAVVYLPNAGELSTGS